MANKKGRSVVGWSLLAVFIVLWAFVIVALLPSKRETPSVVLPESPVTGEVDRLGELRDLYDAGVLSDEEFDAKKAKVLTGV